jgi:hypothetical protein
LRGSDLRVFSLNIFVAHLAFVHFEFGDDLALKTETGELASLNDVLVDQLLNGRFLLPEFLAILDAPVALVKFQRFIIAPQLLMPFVVDTMINEITLLLLILKWRGIRRSPTVTI